MLQMAITILVYWKTKNLKI